ncbi:hypothetical protein AB0A69_03880 [Streptomyces sp. NPDC045431]|uniref:hypothetical protein n=1 Tax=Streptomyces sp. NPDC045431 TaxID=3155613 RepID=UPI0033DE1B06
MRSIRLLGAAGAVCLSLLVAGCGAERVTGAGGAGGSGGSAVVSPPAPSAASEGPDARHDRLFPGLATRCAGLSVSPSPSASTSREPLSPEAQKYAENHAFKQRLPLGARAACRGRAHAERIGGGVDGVRTEGELRAALEKLGYTADDVQTYGSGTGLGFAVFVPGAGPCVSGRVGPPLSVEVHGPYMEGGCVEPRGGH